MIWFILIALYGLEANPWDIALPMMLADQSSKAPLYITLSVGTRWMVPEQRLLAGSSEVSKASTSMAILGEPLWFCSTLVDALLASELSAKIRGSPVPSTSS